MAEGITYPEKGANGANLLRESPIVIEPKPMIYSLRVDLASGNKIRVIIPVPGDQENSWSFFRYAGMSVGWKYAPVFSGSDMEIHFLADYPGNADLPAYFNGHNTIDVLIFENNDINPTRIKSIKW